MIQAMADAVATGSRIRKRRQVLGMTQEDLARKLGISKTTVANWEVGKHFPRRYLGAVEQALGIKLSAPEPETLSPRLRRVIREELPPADQARVIGILEATLMRPPRPTSRGEEQDGAPRPG